MECIQLASPFQTEGHLSCSFPKGTYWLRLLQVTIHSVEGIQLADEFRYACGQRDTGCKGELSGMKTDTNSKITQSIAANRKR
eukprot:1161696-Pelagomonas_calceolata.AAC.11